VELALDLTADSDDDVPVKPSAPKRQKFA